METREERGYRERERERYVLGGERKVNKISKIFFGIDVRTVSYLRWYCSGVVKCLKFEIPNEDWFLVFDVPNADKKHRWIRNLESYCSDNERQLSFTSIIL